MSKKVNVLVFLVMLSLNIGLPIAHSEEAIRLGQRWELFVDEYVIDQMKGEIVLRLHSPAAQEVVLVHDKPWEGSTSGYS